MADFHAIPSDLGLQGEIGEGDTVIVAQSTDRKRRRARCLGLIVKVLGREAQVEFIDGFVDTYPLYALRRVISADGQKARKFEEYLEAQ